MKKLFKFVMLSGLSVLLLIYVISIINHTSTNDLPFKKIERGISDTQFTNIGEMLRKGFTADRETVRRIKVKNIATNYHGIFLTGYFVRVTVNAPGMRNEDAIIFMGGTESEANPIYATDVNSLTAFVMVRNKLYMFMRTIDEWKALNKYVN